MVFILSEDFMLKDIYERIWDLARPYLNTRKNDIHTEISTDLAQLLLAQEGGDEDIVVPAIILHDVGWKKVPEDIQMKAFGPNTTMPEWNRVHEVEGARIAGDILRKVDYHEDKILEIQEIIKGHDSRKDPISKNDSIVKDADKLWRFTPAGVDIDHTRFGIPRDSYMKWLDTVIDDWLFTPEGKEMAHTALGEAKCS